MGQAAHLYRRRVRAVQHGRAQPFDRAVYLGLQIAVSSNGTGGSFGGVGGQGSTSGVTIVGTLSGSPAANAGVTEGDTITAIGGQSVSTAEEIAQKLVKYHPGNSISISWVDTSDQSHTATLTLTSGPAA